MWPGPWRLGPQISLRPRASEAVGDAADRVQVGQRPGVVGELGPGAEDQRHAVVVGVAVPPARGPAHPVGEGEAEAVCEEALGRAEPAGLDRGVLEAGSGGRRPAAPATSSMPQKSL